MHRILLVLLDEIRRFLHFGFFIVITEIFSRPQILFKRSQTIWIACQIWPYEIYVKRDDDCQATQLKPYCLVNHAFENIYAAGKGICRVVAEQQ